MLVHAYAARGVDAIALRYFSVYGRHQRPDMAVARLLDAAADRPPFPLRGDGSQCRDLTHVDDVVAGDARRPRCPARRRAPSSTSGSGRPVALRDVIAEIERQTGVAVPSPTCRRRRAIPPARLPTAPAPPPCSAGARWSSCADGIADQIAHQPRTSVPSRRPWRDAVGRLPASAGRSADPGDPHRLAGDDAPVLLFLPAFDEEAAIADFLARIPATAGGRRLERARRRRRLDRRHGGDRPRTRRRGPVARRQPAASAPPSGPGLRAGCRARRRGRRVLRRRRRVPARGDRRAWSRRSSPATADYVVGSRFLGRIDHMRPTAASATSC